MNDDLEIIKELLYEYSEFKLNKWVMEQDNYKCEHWEGYVEEYSEFIEDFENLKNELVDKCNDFMDYPLSRFLFFNRTKRVSFSTSNMLDLEVLSIPFIDDGKYYCLITLLDSLEDIIGRYSKGNYYFKL